MNREESTWKSKLLNRAGKAAVIYCSASSSTTIDGIVQSMMR